jgi:hypothetical protein
MRPHQALDGRDQLSCPRGFVDHGSVREFLRQGATVARVEKESEPALSELVYQGQTVAANDQMVENGNVKRSVSNESGSSRDVMRGTDHSRAGGQGFGASRAL